MLRRHRLRLSLKASTRSPITAGNLFRFPAIFLLGEASRSIAAHAASPGVPEINMAYIAEISRSNPSCFVFLIDQSGSMNEPLAGAEGRRKCESVAEAINRLLQNLVVKCARGEGVRDFYEVAVIGYGDQVLPAFSGGLAGRDLVPLSEIASAPARIEERRRLVSDGNGGQFEQVTKCPVWFEPRAKGVTPMGGALQHAISLLAPWVEQHPASYPPIVINISDGEATDTGPVPQSRELASLATDDGNVLLFNCHVSSREGQSVAFAASGDVLPDAFARTLFELSSLLPGPLLEQARAEGLALEADARGFAFNADLTELIRFLDLGTRSSHLK